MYNRYIPQNDGSYRRNRMPEDAASKRPVPPNPPPPRPPDIQAPPPCSPSQGNSVFGFFKQLLPKGFDTGDLIVVLLLLLMAGDCEENKNTALLTMALYFFL